MNAIPQLVFDALSLGGIYAMAALGIALIFGVMKLVNFAHGEYIAFCVFALIVPSTDGAIIRWEERCDMSTSIFETTVGAFEKRMLLRRQMFALAGVSLKTGQSAASEAGLRDSVINCFECKSGAICKEWLETAQPGAAHPDFCPNGDIIFRLKAGGHTATHSR